MSIALIIHFFIMISFIPLGVMVYKKYKTSSGSFFLFFSILISIWFFLYTLVFTKSLPADMILTLNRVMYGLSMSFLFCMLFFILFFHCEKKKNLKIKIFIYIILTILFSLSACTPYVLESVSFIEDK